MQHADQLISRGFHQALQADGIAVSEWRVLAMLHESGELSLSTLADLTMLPQPTTTHAVARLLVDGHVSRRAGTVDRRHRFVALTASGQALAERLLQEASTRTADVLVDVDAAALDRLRRDIVALIDRITPTAT